MYLLSSLHFVQVFYEHPETNDSLGDEAGSNTRTAGSAPRFAFLTSLEEWINFSSSKQLPLLLTYFLILTKMEAYVMTFLCESVFVYPSAYAS
jgi:hypothetical protein